MPSKTFSIIDWVSGFVITILLAFCLRMLEWPCWQNPEYRFGDEMLLATHDAYHWVAGACGFGRAIDHPMSIMLAFLANLSTFTPAQAAFWIPAIFGSLAGGAVFLWGKLFSNTPIAIAAGLITTISPGFLGRTLLGYYDTDIITLLFPLIISFFPAVWLYKISHSSGLLNIFFKKPVPNNKSECNLSLLCILLSISGLVGYWSLEWHSVFPYIIRYDILFIFGFVLIIKENITQNISLALCFALTAAFGYFGFIWTIIWLLAVNKYSIFSFIHNKLLLIILWAVIFIWVLHGEIFNTLLNHINAYLKHSAEIHVSGTSSLKFPAVAQSIIEVQDLSFFALFPYFHPWLEAAIIGFASYFLVILKRPTALFLLPLAALGLLSARMGGRMVMFGAPIMALGISILCFWIINYILKRWISYKLSAWVCSLLLCGFLIIPFLDMIPALSQGPILNRRHATALAQAGAITPQDAVLWLWWDWGYAAHYFARRNTISDGALHGGPSLYLPAAVFATPNPRFARQIIARTSKLDNEPGNFFKNMDPVQAQELLNKLSSNDTPLIEGDGHLYIIVSFEMLKLGFWISNFGNWNFISASGEGGALSIVPEGVSYRLGAGEVRLDGRPGLIYPASINIFAETGITVKDYITDWFINHPNATLIQQKAWLASRRNINFLFNRVTDEKLAVDQGIYDSLMIQLLICDANDPRFTPYFRLVYDNVFARIYEVLPQAKVK